MNTPQHQLRHTSLISPLITPLITPLIAPLIALLITLSACGGGREMNLGGDPRGASHRSYPISGRYTPITMLAKYAGEDQPPMDMSAYGEGGAEGGTEGEARGGSDVSQGEPDVVLYWDDVQRAEHLIRVRDGKLIDAKGEPLDAHLDKEGNEERGGSAIFVMDLVGNIYYCFDQRYGRLHHSTLSAGLPVASAGELVIINGELISISNASGHYRPAPQTLDLVLGRLRELGLNVDKTERFEILPKEGEPEYERLPMPLPPRERVR